MSALRFLRRFVASESGAPPSGSTIEAVAGGVEHMLSDVAHQRRGIMCRIFLLGHGKLRTFHAEDAVFADSTPSQPPGYRPLTRAKKNWPKGVGSIASSETRNTARFPQNTPFMGSCPTSGAGRWFSKSCRTRRRSSKRSAGATTTRFAWRATVAVLQRERSLVLNRNPARVVRLQPTTRTSRRSTTTASRTSPEPADGELQLLPGQPP